MPDGVKRSKMEKWLGEQIARAPTAQAADCKRAELAAYLARLGRFDESRELIEPLRQRNARHPGSS